MTTDISPSDPNIRTGNLNLWADFLFVLGINNSYITKGELDNWIIKPYIGFELYGITLTWGYGFEIKNNELSNYSKHIFNLRYYYPIFRFKNNN